jgi:tripartite-type tricarboxylate transporter receptor subunit TctC
MSVNRPFAWLCWTVMPAIFPGIVCGQEYPNKPIRMVAAAAGGGNDFLARIIAQGLAGSAGQQVIVDNRVLIIAAETVAKAQPDGYTVLITGVTFWLGPLMRKTPYDPVKDFSPIILVASAPNILVVHPSLPVKSVKELIALAKAKPGQLSYGSGGAGSSNHLAAELFKSMAGVDILRVSYKGVGPAINDVIAGQVQLVMPNTGSAMVHVRSGRLRALAVASTKPSALAPGIPTVSASGVPGYEAVAMTGMFAPAKTSDRVINRLNQEIAKVLNQSEVKARLFDIGAEVVGGSPQEFAVSMEAEVVRMGKVIRDLGIRED